MFDLLEPTHLLLIFLVAVVVFGPKRLVEMSRSLGQTMQSIQDYKEELRACLVRVRVRPFCTFSRCGRPSNPAKTSL